MKIYDSCKHALNGFIYALKTQRNLRIEFIISIITIAISILLKINVIEWLIVVAIMILVIICELFNSAIETLADIINGKHDLRIKIVKDMAAAAVFLSAAISLIVGIAIFVPDIIKIILKEIK